MNLALHTSLEHTEDKVAAEDKVTHGRQSTHTNLHPNIYVVMCNAFRIALQHHYALCRSNDQYLQVCNCSHYFLLMHNV